MQPSALRDQEPVQFCSLRRVLIKTAQQVQIAGGTHRPEKLVLDALRSGQVRARGLFHGDVVARWIEPAEWKRFTIEIETDPILVSLTPVVRSSLGGRGAPPAVTNVDLESHGVETWLTRVRPTLCAPKAAPAKRLPRLSAKTLITAEVKRRTELGNVPATITLFSRELAEFMLSRKKAGDRVCPLMARTIENRLRDWKLFPIKKRPQHPTRSS
jgi:hypothetical protein